MNESGTASPQRAGRNRSGAFQAAARHTSRVRLLRKAIIIGCSIAAVALLVRAFYDPFSSLPGNLSIARQTLSGTRVTMEMPKLSGFRSDGRPYDVRARSGVQDIRHPGVIELNEIDARFDVKTGQPLRVVAPQGVYDGSKDFMRLLEDVRITSENNYDIRLKDTDVDFKLGHITSKQPVSVVMTSGTIRADQLEAIDHGERIIFDGNVRSVFRVSASGTPDEETAP